MPALSQPIPPPIGRMVDDAGQVTDVWYRFFLAVFARTGGPLGVATPGGAVPQPVGYSDLLASVTGSQQKFTALSAQVDDLGLLQAISDMLPESVISEAIVQDIQIMQAFQPDWIA